MLTTGLTDELARAFRSAPTASAVIAATALHRNSARRARILRRRRQNSARLHHGFPSRRPSPRSGIFQRDHTGTDEDRNSFIDAPLLCLFTVRLACSIGRLLNFFGGEFTQDSPQSNSNKHPPEYRLGYHGPCRRPPFGKPTICPYARPQLIGRDQTLPAARIPSRQPLRRHRLQNHLLHSCQRRLESHDSASPSLEPRLTSCPTHIHGIHNSHYCQPHRIRILRSLPHRLVIRRHQHYRADNSRRSYPPKSVAHRRRCHRLPASD